MGNGLQDPALSLEELYEQARQALPDFEAFGNNLLQYLQAKYPKKFDNVKFECAPLKKMERIQEKAIGDYGGDYSKVADIVRGRLVVETPEQIEIIRSEVAALQKDLGIVKVKDFYAEPLITHFRSLNTQIQLPNGHIAEFRFDQKDMVVASEYSHIFYEEMQGIERTAKNENRPFTESEAQRWDELLEEQRTLFHEPAQKANLDVLLNEKGAKMLEEYRASKEAIKTQTLTEEFTKVARNADNVVLSTALGKKTEGVGKLVADLKGAKNIPEIVDALKTAKAGMRSLKFGSKATIIGGVATTAAVGALLHHIHSSQKDIADQLFEDGKLSQEAYDEYIDLNEDIEKMMQAENIAGQGWFFLVTTPAVELRAKEMFDEFSHKYNLPQDMHEALGMSMFDGESLQGKFASEIRETVSPHMVSYRDVNRRVWVDKNPVEELPEELHKLRDLEGKLSQAEGKNNWAGTRIRVLSRNHSHAEIEEMKQQTQSQLNEAQSAYVDEFEKLISNPETANILLSRLDPDVLVDMAVETARYNYEGENPIFERLAKAQMNLEDISPSRATVDERRALREEIDNIKEELKDNPEILHSYIVNVFAPEAQGEPEASLENEHGATDEALNPQAERLQGYMGVLGYGSNINEAMQAYIAQENPEIDVELLTPEGRELAVESVMGDIDFRMASDPEFLSRVKSGTIELSDQSGNDPNEIQNKAVAMALEETGYDDVASLRAENKEGYAKAFTFAVGDKYIEPDASKTISPPVADDEFKIPTASYASALTA